MNRFSTAHYAPPNFVLLGLAKAIWIHNLKRRLPPIDAEDNRHCYIVVKLYCTISLRYAQFLIPILRLLSQSDDPIIAYFSYFVF